MKNIFLFLFAVTACSCCEHISDDVYPTKGLKQSVLFYENSFDTLGSEINGGYISSFNESNVIGPFNKSGFSIHLDSLPNHDFILLSFDFYAHDTWDGNVDTINGYILGPDLWTMEVDEWLAVPDSLEELVFTTTFSTSSCGLSCSSQSFPEQYPFTNSARSGATRMNLPGFCHLKEQPNGTYLYKIEKIFPHTGKGLAVRFYDYLRQTNTNDELCNESWSMDNLKIRTWKAN